MDQEHINHGSMIGLIVLSLTALSMTLPVAVRALVTGVYPDPRADEGTGAHIFQLSIVALAPVGLAFLASANWTRPAQIARRLLVPAVAVVLAFACLYYFEKYLPAHAG